MLIKGPRITKNKMFKPEDTVIVEAKKEDLIDLGWHEDNVIKWLMNRRPKKVKSVQCNRIFIYDPQHPEFDVWVTSPMIYKPKKGTYLAAS
jgi:hypothetical protein